MPPPGYLIDMEITKREVLFSIAIACVLFTVGLAIAGNIDAYLQDKYEAYNTALQVADDPELFEYGMRTNVGNAFAHGELRAVDPVSITDIPGVYGYIQKTKQRHTRHTRTVTVRDGKGHTWTRTETYWTWDNVEDWEWHCKEISFLGHAFPYGTIDLPHAVYIDTIYESGAIRYVYYACADAYTGTLWARLVQDGLFDTAFYADMDIEQTIKRLESGWEKVLFWAIWVLLILGAVIGFYYGENRWLEE